VKEFALAVTGRVEVEGDRVTADDAQQRNKRADANSVE
jgi:hypothetical protein